MLRIFFKTEYKKFLLLFLLPFFFAACQENKLKVKVEDIPVKVSLSRFEQDLFTVNQTNYNSKSQELQKKYPDFYPLFARNIIRVADRNDTIFKNNLLMFLNDPDIKDVYKQTQTMYYNFSDYHEQLTEAFKHYKYYFPKKVVPRLLTFVSGFNYAIVGADSVLGIGLDMYLGSDCKYYPAIGFPKYKMDKMNRNFIVTDAMKGWAQSEYPYDESKKDFLSHIIYEGKILYFLDAMFPEMEDSLKIGYSKVGMKWSKASEANIWSFIIEKKMLFSTDFSSYHKFISEGPGTNGFPKEAPDRLGVFIGWQIVKKYMENNPDISLEQLMNEQNAQKILTESKYKPSK